MYTSVTQDTVDAVLAGFRQAEPGVQVDVFRALSGQVNTRIATEEQTGGVKADVVWHSDPLSMQPLAARGRLLAWTPHNVAAVPARYRAGTFYGTRLLNMVIVHRRGDSPAPVSWSDLASEPFQGAVAIPNPAAAGTAFGALGYFSGADGYGLDYYRRLKANGAVQVQTINDVITGVAQGRYKAGMTLETSARQEIAKGAPIDIVWPTPGAISIFSPAAVVKTSPNLAAAQALLDYLISADGQRRIAATGWQPVRADVPGPSQPPGTHLVAPDWPRLYDRQQKLLDDYRQIFGG
ncbi:MAG: extracellular solute-binding protein [Candidatus Dormibacteraeota bacterium]|nr:extracellular solute-binding protein [Candidatus Dormibacteraeota bacterium]